MGKSEILHSSGAIVLELCKNNSGTVAGVAFTALGINLSRIVTSQNIDNESM